VSIVPVTEAQTPSYDISYLTVDDGLSQNGSQAILIDRLGFLWFGTQDGLNKYDGYRFTVYKNIPNNPASLSNNKIVALYEDRKGAVEAHAESAEEVILNPLSRAPNPGYCSMRCDSCS
jgi:ligand-binding sensor domain-containing protein